MAKSQKRSNREIKKPKADKKVVADTAPAGSVPGVMAKPKSGAGAPARKG